MLKKLYALKRVFVVWMVMVLPAVSSEASFILYQFEPISSGPDPGGQTPQIQATFEDVDPGTVQLTLTASGLASGEFLSGLYFNFDPVDNVNRMRFKRLDGPRGLVSPHISTGVNAFEADGGYYDVHFDFSKTGRATISGNDFLTYLITEPGLDALDFAFLDSTGNCAGTNGQYYALARIQGTCGDTEWLGATSVQSVPEPASLGFLALAAAGLLWCSRRQLNRTKPFVPARAAQAKMASSHRS